MSRSYSEIIEPPNPLGKAKSGDGPVRIDPNILHRAEEAVEELNDEYSSWAQKDIAAVAEAANNPEELRNAIAEIYKRALDLKGQGGGFGYDLITSIGDLLTKFMEDRDTINERDSAVINAHIDAMQAVIREDIKGDGGKIGFQIVDGLGELVQKFES